MSAATMSKLSKTKKLGGSFDMNAFPTSIIPNWKYYQSFTVLTATSRSCIGQLEWWKDGDEIVRACVSLDDITFHKMANDNREWHHLISDIISGNILHNYQVSRLITLKMLYESYIFSSI